MTAHGDLSSILGWVSIACWVVVYSPQIIENFRLKSGEGLSVAFVSIWLLGDLCNLGGAVMAGLLPTVIILAVYYTLCDVILLVQIYYYRWTSKREGPSMVSDVAPDITTVGEETPLLSDSRESSREEFSVRREFVKFGGALLFVFAAGVLGWWISGYIGKAEGSPNSPDDHLEWRSQVLGWISAALYIGARIPQIFKNFKTRCEGLSPFLFVFSITGNTTYALSICAASMAPKYLLKNASWLAGSVLTIFLDVFVLCQFFYYRSVERGNTQPLS
ncbi:PQ-loop-domain-containing protein [Gloeophyllum trabeum ATCC 11539]|uniref:PQ-loop-domain-containing protein n=1 Tax=Gloeophyllum trabeum (strain ATCC 11539 / FP-39264 / Madison 617) TaxID=670483 RepID=S7Q573_GLOTA|nr:PQ-loop-domain-containing protein [Gloeophyllum trabeum ATCC 11539]EPQ54657.1 PQ-loop-domain-containing protein [Gloeophyllum trabeum ATCC 11539]